MAVCAVLCDMNTFEEIASGPRARRPGSGAFSNSRAAFRPTTPSTGCSAS
jgi:hypothetical protein